MDSAPSLGHAPYERNRLVAASRLAVQRTGNPYEFFVQSRSRPDQPWAVKLDGDPMCECEDNQFRTRQCAHVLAARLASGDLPLIQALGNILLEVQRKSEALEKDLRRANRRKPAA